MWARGEGRLSKAQNQRREKRVADGSHSSGRSETRRLLVLRLNKNGGSPLYSSSRAVRSHLRGEWSRPSGFILLPVLSEASRASCRHLGDGAERMLPSTCAGSRAARAMESERSGPSRHQGARRMLLSAGQTPLAPSPLPAEC